MRIDVSTNQISQTVAVEPLPANLAGTSDAIWLTSLHNDAVVHIDPHSGEVGEAVALTKSDGIAIDGDDVWVVLHRDNSLVRLNAGTHQELARVHLGAASLAAKDVAVGGGAVWVSHQVDAATFAVSRVDPRTNQVVATIRTGTAAPNGIAVDNNGVWIARADGMISRINTSTYELSSMAVGQTLDGVAVDHGILWVTSGETNSLLRLAIQSP